MYSTLHHCIAFSNCVVDEKDVLDNLIDEDVEKTMADDEGDETPASPAPNKKCRPKKRAPILEDEPVVAGPSRVQEQGPTHPVAPKNKPTKTKKKATTIQMSPAPPSSSPPLVTRDIALGINKLLSEVTRTNELLDRVIELNTGMAASIATIANSVAALPRLAEALEQQTAASAAAPPTPTAAAYADAPGDAVADTPAAAPGDAPAAGPAADAGTAELVADDSTDDDVSPLSLPSSPLVSSVQGRCNCNK